MPRILESIRKLTHYKNIHHLKNEHLVYIQCTAINTAAEASK